MRDKYFFGCLDKILNTLSVSDQNLLKLYKIFDGTFERALDLYEQQRVTQFSTSSTIITEPYKNASEVSWLMQVRGHSGASYTLFPEVNYCTCAAFRYNILYKSRTGFKRIVKLYFQNFTFYNKWLIYVMKNSYMALV